MQRKNISSGSWATGPRPRPTTTPPLTLVYPARLDAAWFEDGHLIPPLVDATCLASKREVLRTAGAWFGRGTEEPPPRFLPGGREPPRNEVTFALYETDAGKRCRTAYFDKIWTEFTRHPQRATTAEDVTFVLADLDTMMWSWPNPNIGLVGPTSWIAGDRPTCYPWPSRSAHDGPVALVGRRGQRAQGPAPAAAPHLRGADARGPTEARR